MDSPAPQPRRPASPPALLRGRRIGGYEVVEELGRGGMGIVLRVRSLRDGRERAMKVLLGDQRLRVQRFAREIEVSQRLDHPNLVRVEEWGDLDGRPWFVMPLIPGEDLSAVVKRGLVTPERSARWVATIARAVHQAHTEGVIHRDLKPGNIRISPEGEPFVLDFGMAKDHDAAEALSRSGIALGTPAFWAPEQARALHAQVDARTDVYALGVILFELLTGQPVFPAHTTAELVEKILQADPPRPSALRPDVPPDLEAICLRCLRKEQGERFPSALSLAEALEARASDAPPPAAPRAAWILGAVLLCGALGLWIGASLTGGTPPPPTPRPTVSDAPALGPAELPVPRDELVAAVAAAQAQPSRDDFLAGMRKLERRLTAALTRAEPAASAELKLHRGRLRRALGRWAAAVDDLEAAARSPHVAAEAQLARSVILTRWEQVPEHADVAFVELQAAGADDSARGLVGQIAAVYLLIGADRLDAAAQRALGLIRADLPLPLATEAYLALAFAARRSAEAGEAEQAWAWLEDAERDGPAPRHSYLYVADRAAVLAWAGRLEEAAEDLSEARRTEPDAWSQLTTRLLLTARRGELQSLRDQREPALVRARSLGREHELETWLGTLADEALRASAPPVDVGLSYPTVLTLERTPLALDLVLPGGRSDYQLVFDLTTSYVGFELLGADEDVDLWFRRDRRPVGPGEAQLHAAGPAFEESLLAARLRPGFHHLVIHRVSTSPAPLGVTLVVRQPAPGTVTPLPWPQVRDQGLPLGDVISEDFERALDTWGSGSESEALDQLETLERVDPASRLFLRFVRAELLVSAGRIPEAEALLAELEDAPPPPLHVRMPFLKAQAALAAGEPQRALDLLEPLLAEQPRLLDAQLLRAEAALAASRPELLRATLAALQLQRASLCRVLEGAQQLAQGEREQAYASLGLHPGMYPSLRAVRRAVQALLAADEPERALSLVEAHAPRWEGGDVLAVERWACLQALGRDASPPPRESLSPSGRLRLARLRALIRD